MDGELNAENGALGLIVFHAYGTPVRLHDLLHYV